MSIGTLVLPHARRACAALCAVLLVTPVLAQPGSQPEEPELAPLAAPEGGDVEPLAAEPPAGLATQELEAAAPASAPAAVSAPAVVAAPVDETAEPVPAVDAAATPGAALGLDLLLRLDAFVTQGRTFGVDVSNGSSDGLHGVNYAVNLGLAYTPPLPEPWRIVALSVDVGYTPFFGTGRSSLSQWQSRGGVLERSTVVYQYDWSVHMIPIDLGLRLRVPWSVLGVEFPVVVEGEAGFAGGVAIARSTLTVEGAAAPFARDVGTSDFGLGYYLGLGAAYPLPPGLGSVTAAYRYSAVRLDFHRPDFNATWGDLGGHHLLLGYRFEW